ncbi:MAG: hypothetical protein F4097_03280 [Cenarchaeum sp. SB0672_bin_9]|nr:hypothetical protein [Cenarchaeum sp. SB0672_bin_9]
MSETRCRGSFYYSVVYRDDMEKLSTKDIFVRGSILGAIITVPSVSTFLILWYITGEMIIPAVVAAAVHFATMMLSYKFAKKILVKHVDDKR